MQERVEIFKKMTEHFKIQQTLKENQSVTEKKEENVFFIRELNSFIIIKGRKL